MKDVIGRVHSKGEKGFSTDMCGFGPQEIWDLLAEITNDKDIANKDAKFWNGTKVKIDVSLEELTSILEDDNTPYLVAKGEAKKILYDGWGVIFGTDLIEGERYYDVDVGEDGDWFVLPERILEKFK